MNGAIAEPPPITNITPIKSSTTTTGTKKTFLRSLKKLNISLKNSIIIILIFETLK